MNHSLNMGAMLIENFAIVLLAAIVIALLDRKLRKPRITLVCLGLMSLGLVLAGLLRR